MHIPADLVPMIATGLTCTVQCTLPMFIFAVLFQHITKRKINIPASCIAAFVIAVVVATLFVLFVAAHT